MNKCVVVESFFALKIFCCVCRFLWRRPVARIGGGRRRAEHRARLGGKPRKAGYEFGVRFGVGLAVKDEV